MKHALWIVVLVAACGRDGGPASEVSPGVSRAAVTTVPTAGLTADLQTALSRDPQQLQVIAGPKGRRVDLQGGFQSAAIIRRAADGSLQAECFDDHAEAQAFLQTAPAKVRSTAEVQ